MFRYLTVAIAAIYVVLLVFGEEDRRQEVSRAATDDATGLTLASFALPETSQAVALLESTISDSEAVQIALQAGEDFRINRPRKTLLGTEIVASKEAVVVEIDAETTGAQNWYVTGSRVNLRAGPGTGNAVVGQLVLGDAAEVLGDADGWPKIRTTDGQLSGWIFGNFLSETQPG